MQPVPVVRRHPVARYDDHDERRSAQLPGTMGEFVGPARQAALIPDGHVDRSCRR
jgi:hypothetical protein